MLYLSLGLGQVLMMGRDLNDMSAVIAVMILIIAIGYVVDGVVFRVDGAPFAAQVGLDAVDLGRLHSRKTPPGFRLAVSGVRAVTRQESEE